MSWQDIIKSKKNAFPKQNLQLMKDISEEIYMSIPIGKVFSAIDYWDKFKKMIINSEPEGQQKRNFTLWLRGNPFNWYNNFFLKYGKHRNYIVNAGDRKFRKVV